MRGMAGDNEPLSAHDPAVAAFPPGIARHKRHIQITVRQSEAVGARQSLRDHQFLVRPASENGAHGIKQRLRGNPGRETDPQGAALPARRLSSGAAGSPDVVQSLASPFEEAAPLAREADAKGKALEKSDAQMMLEFGDPSA